MVGSDIIARALSIADLTNAGSITAADQLNSLQETYNDINHILIDSDDDYYLNEVIQNVTSAMAAPNGNANEYLVPLPADMFKLRYVDYNVGQTGQVWQRMDRFTLAEKNYNAGRPIYRMKNSNLWLIGMPTGNLQVRIGYYPPPVTVTLLTDFSYPLNSVPELMSYQLAMDFLAKQGTPDPNKIAYLQQRYQQLHDRFIDEVRRDVYQPERVKNSYDLSGRGL